MCSELVGAMPKGCEEGGLVSVVCNAQHCYQVIKLWDAFITLVFIPDVLRLAPNTL